MNAGMILKQKVEEDTKIVILEEDETSCLEAGTNDEIVETLKQKEPEVIAVDAGTQVSRDEFNKMEEELKEEGHVFTPTSHETKKARRLEALKARLFEEMGAERPEIIRFEPKITADELAVHDDSGIESYGIDPSGIESAEMFDAMLGAITARFYEQNQVKNLGVIIPEPLGNQSE